MTGAKVQITMTKEQAEKISFGLSDILCWVNGFNAGRSGTDFEGTGPLGVEETRTISIKIKDALSRLTQEAAQ